MTEFKEAPSPLFPDKDKEHEEPKITIVSIKDAKGNSIKDGATGYDTRQFAVLRDNKGKITDKTIITFKIEKHEVIFIIVWLKVDPGNKLAEKYYKTSYKILSYHDGSIGEHKLEWDGRPAVDGDGQRLIIQGDYIIQIEGRCSQCGMEVKDEAKIKVKKAYADAYGAVYPAAYGSPSDLRPPAAHVRSELKNLPDGSGFETGGSATDSAHTALKQMKEKSGVWYWDGHARAGGIVFYDAAVNKTYIVSDNCVATAIGYPEAALAEVVSLEDLALRDIFLVVLLGCHTADKPDCADSLPTALNDKGVDLVVAMKGGPYLRAYLKWTRDFISGLKDGKGVNEAAEDARSDAPAADRPSLEFDVYTSGESKESKLLPARYGRKKD